MLKKPVIAVAFLAFAGMTTSALAQDRWHRGDGARGLFTERLGSFEGDITFEDFAAAARERFARADADGDGKLTVEELAAEIQRMRYERMARRAIERFDVDGDGELTLEEIENRLQKRFALMDRDDSGTIERAERPRRQMQRGERMHRGEMMRRGGERRQRRD